MSSDESHPAAVAVVGSVTGVTEVAGVVDRGDGALVVREFGQGWLLVVDAAGRGRWVVPASLGRCPA
jgi:hypothetical protein